MPDPSLRTRLESAFSARTDLSDEKHQSAFRLFNGFTEGCPALVVDLYAATAVLHNYADPPAEGEEAVRLAVEILQERFPWLKTILLKTRNSPDLVQKRGRLLYGTNSDRKVCEHGVWYALDLTMNQDASLYLDTRNLRRWAVDNLSGKRVLNTFAYTGSLGVAAQAGGAERVVHLDLNRVFLNVAKTSYTLNGFPIHKGDFQTGDFWPQINRLKRSGELFDCVFLDPPFFSTTGKGRVDLAANNARLINKVRPLIADGGWLVAINNALFLSGQEYIQTLENLCADGYLKLESLIPVPVDFTGYPHTIVGVPPADPAPFNHPTKIVLLSVRRKST
jgi:23S rRNA (cytosine1962-C5)-methyltransferase